MEEKGTCCVCRIGLGETSHDTCQLSRQGASTTGSVVIKHLFLAALRTNDDERENGFFLSEYEP